MTNHQGYTPEKSVFLTARWLIPKPSIDHVIHVKKAKTKWQIMESMKLNEKGSLNVQRLTSVKWRQSFSHQRQERKNFFSWPRDDPSITAVLFKFLIADPRVAIRILFLSVVFTIFFQAEELSMIDVVAMLSRMFI